MPSRRARGAEPAAPSARLDIPRPSLDKTRSQLPRNHMSHAELAKTIDDAFEKRDGIGPTTKGAVREAVETALDLLDRGAVRVAVKGDNGNWSVNQWLKKAVLLSFRLNDMSVDRKSTRLNSSHLGISY